MRDEQMHQRLLDWAQYLTVGDGSGYPVMSVLHPMWQPPAPGTSPTMKTSAPSSAWQTHCAIAQLKQKLRDALVMHYVFKGTMVEQATRLDCMEATVYRRVELAQRQLRALLLRGQRKTFCNKEEVG